MKRRIFLSSWIPPVLTVVSLPAHAETTTLDFLDFDFKVSDRTCDDESDPHTATFTICNNEGTVQIELMEVFVFGEDVADKGISINPAIPLTIEHGECIQFAIQASGGLPFECGLDSIDIKGSRVDHPAKGFFNFFLINEN